MAGEEVGGFVAVVRKGVGLDLSCVVGGEGAYW